VNAVCLYSDEDVDGAVWRGLKRLGIDTESAVSECMLGRLDEDQLLYSSENQRVLLTHNVKDFPRLHGECLSNGRSHMGIIIASRALSIGEIIRRIARLTAELSAEQMMDRLEYLSNW
jgi:hypothetical protein